MAAPIVVDVGVAEPQRELAAALIEACTEAAAGADTDCRLVRDAQSGPYTAIAIVTWEEGDRVRVEVGLRRQPASEWRTRELTFQAGDVNLERYRSVGFVIAALATSASEEATPTPSKAANSASPAGTAPATPGEVPAAAAPTKSAETPKIERPKTEPALEPPLKRSEREAPSGPSSPRIPRRYGWLGVVGTLGGGLDHGAPRYGGQVWLGVRVVPHVSVLASGGLSERARDASGLEASWLDGGIGLGVSIGPLSLPHVDVREQLLGERFSADARRGGEHAENSRVTWADRVGIDGVLPLGDVLDFVLGVDGTFRPATRVRVGSETDGSTRNFELGASAGLRGEL